MVQCKIQVSSVETQLVLGGGVKSELRCQTDRDPLNSVRHVVQYSHISHVKQDLALHPAGGLVAVQHAENLPVGDDGQLLLDPALRALAPLLEVALECWSVAPLDQLLRVYCSHKLAFAQNLANIDVSRLRSTSTIRTLTLPTFLLRVNHLPARPPRSASVGPSSSYLWIRSLVFTLVRPRPASS